MRRGTRGNIVLEVLRSDIGSLAQPYKAVNQNARGFRFAQSIAEMRNKKGSAGLVRRALSGVAGLTSAPASPQPPDKPPERPNSLRRADGRHRRSASELHILNHRPGGVGCNSVGGLDVGDGLS